MRIEATVNRWKLVTVPSGVVTLSGPVVAPFGTIAWITIGAVTVKLALTPLNVTEVAPVKFAPLIVTPYPSGPYAGVKLVIASTLATVTLTAAAVAVFPAASRATAVKE